MVALTELIRQLKDVTIDGCYTSKAGLTQELGRQGNTMLPEFPSRTHSEHKGDASRKGDPKRSALSSFRRSHEVKNLFAVDGSGSPTALARQLKSGRL